MNRKFFIKTIICIVLAVRGNAPAPVTPVVKVVRSECKVCNGTGRVKAGDGFVVVDRECDNCYVPESKEEPAPDVPSVEVDEEEAPPPPAEAEVKPNRTITVHMADFYCLPCERLKSQVLDKTKIPFTTTKGSKEIRFFPTIVLMEDGKEVKRYAGALGWRQFHEFFYYDKYTAALLRKWCKDNSVTPYYFDGRDGRSLKQHVCDDHDVKFEMWQLEGLTQQELQEIHGGQHTGQIKEKP